jgi:tRNA threonylcarbamoyladenosine biosynthesis protein TsaB
VGSFATKAWPIYNLFFDQVNSEAPSMSTPIHNSNSLHNAESHPVILALDTSATRPGLAIRRGPELLAVLVSSRVEPHSRTLFDNLNLLLDQAQLTIKDVDVFAVVTGPGSFTGLRVGMAAIKGLAAAHQRPLYGVDLFELNAQALGCAATVLVICAGGRGEVFCALRQLAPNGEVLTPGQELYGQPASAIPAILDQLAPPDRLRLLITGDGVELAHELLVQRARQLDIPLSSIVFAAPALPGWQIVKPGLSPVLQLSLSVWQNLQSPVPARHPGCHPFYVRPSDAEINWTLS